MASEFTVGIRQGRVSWWVRFAAALLVVVACAAAIYGAMHMWGDEEAVPTLVLAGLGFSIVGALVLARTGHRVGWALCCTGLAILFSGVAGVLADSGELVGDALGGALWLSWFFFIGLLMFWFPTGEPLTPRWRWLLWMGVIGEVFSLTYVVSEQLCADESESGCSAWVDNPIGIPGVPHPEYGNLSGVTFMLVVVFAVLAAVSLVIRYRRSSGVERLQIKWFAFAVVNAITLMVVSEVLQDLIFLPDWVLNALYGLSVLALPIAIGVSVLRYRLYEIDRIVSRTVTYAFVAVLLALVFAGIAALTAFLPTDSDLVVAAATLAVVALFNPLRRRVQGWVDRRFNRSRYDAARVMDGFASSLRSQVDPDDVVEGWVGVVSMTMQPSSAGVWVRDNP
jgi:hypothetical protein